MSINLSLFDNSACGATFSRCRAYRFALWRIWDESKPFAMFIGLNPSTANETEPDRTIERVIRISKHNGLGGVYMMNLFPFVTPYPKHLQHCGHFEISYNDELLKNISKKCSEVVFCWGVFKEAADRAKKIIEMFPDAKCLRKTKAGHPWHPLYMKGTTTLISF
jgi:hypothetical protein